MAEDDDGDALLSGWAEDEDEEGAEGPARQRFSNTELATCIRVGRVLRGVSHAALITHHHHHAVCPSHLHHTIIIIIIITPLQHHAITIRSWCARAGG